MFKLKSKKKNETKQVSVKAPSAFDSIADFEYANLDASMHERPMQGKPTTYLKDALKRFTKNRSSVVAFIILMILIIMAIVVPFANKNNIREPNPRTRYLPPKWNEVNSSHFMDGTGFIKEGVLDPHPEMDENGNPIWKTAEKSGYDNNAVVGDIKVNEVVTTEFSSALGDYGTGGDFIINVDKKSGKNDEIGGLQSQIVNLRLDDDVKFDVTFDVEAMKDQELSYYPAFILSEHDDEIVPLTETFTAPIDKVSISENDYINALENSEAYKTKHFSGFNGRFAIIVNPTNTKQQIAVTSINFDKSDLDKNTKKFLSWTDATVAYTDHHNETKIHVPGKGEEPMFYDVIGSYTGFSIYGGKLYYGEFVYDYYKAAYGEQKGHIFTKAEIDDYIAKGWMTINMSALEDEVTNQKFDPSNFELTEAGEIYCPLRNIETYTKKYDSFIHEDTFSVTGEISWYRYDYSVGMLAKCAMPKFAFGTNKAGNDFFKLVFSGLLTSLGLGFLSSFINIFVGLIWGSISGYFGGWVDLLMERFTEILGGMPWIVMMTLIVLLMGSTFWTFLLALCLTGWMGVAHMARSQFYRFKGREYVLASRTLGASDGRLIFKHILPNGIGTIITSSILMIPSVIFVEANISYLLPNALAFKDNDSFGITLSTAQADLAQYPYLIVSASIIMALIMISFNLFGNGLRDAFNPSLKGADE